MRIYYGAGIFSIDYITGGLKELIIKYDGYIRIIKKTAEFERIDYDNGIMSITFDTPFTERGVLFKYVGYFKIHSVKADNITIPVSTSNIHLWNEISAKWNEIDSTWDELGNSFLQGRIIKKESGYGRHTDSPRKLPTARKTKRLY